MADKPIELSDKDAADQVKVASGPVDRVITDNVVGGEKKIGGGIKQAPIGRGKGFGTTAFDSTSVDPNKRLSLAEDPKGEKNRELLDAHRAKKSDEKSE